MSKEEKAVEQKQEKQFMIDNSTAIKIKLLEFDKKIAEADAEVANLKRQRITYLYDSTVQSVIANSNK